MKRTEYRIKGLPPYVLYETQSKDIVICIGGTGEAGPNDGSQLSKIDNIGFPQLAKSGKEYPFNVAGVQLIGVTIYQLEAIVKEFAKTYEKIFITGLSQGGQTIWEAARKYKTLFETEVTALIPIAGNDPQAVWTGQQCTTADIPIKTWHNDGDPQMRWKGGEELLVNAINACQRKNKVEVRLYQANNHGGWVEAYKWDGEVQKYIEVFINETVPVPDPVPAKKHLFVQGVDQGEYNDEPITIQVK